MAEREHEPKLVLHEWRPAFAPQREREDRATAKKGDDLARRYVAPTGWTLATIGHRANGPRGEAQICEQRAAAIAGRVTRCPGPSGSAPGARSRRSPPTLPSASPPHPAPGRP